MEGKSAKKFSKGMVGCATASLYERDFTKRLEKMSALSALPPPLTTIRRKLSLLRLRRPSLPAGRQGVQRGQVRPDACTTDIISHTCYGVRQGLSKGCIPIWGRVSGYLWGVTLCLSARYSGQPQIWDAPSQKGAVQNGGGFGACLWPATRAAGETPAFPGGCPQIWTTPSQRGAVQNGGGPLKRNL